jgi:hypothetical protein
LFYLPKLDLQAFPQVLSILGEGDFAIIYHFRNV